MRASRYACAVIVQDGRVLLGRRAAHRKAYAGYWDVIGGRIEQGETPEAALRRELGEELGIVPKAPKHLATLHDQAINPADPPDYLLFKVTQWESGAPRIANHEHTHLEWFSLRQAKDLKNLALEAYCDVFEAALR